MSKRNQKKQKAVPAQATNNVSLASVGASVGDEDRKILELAKQAMKDKELDIQEFIKLLECFRRARSKMEEFAREPFVNPLEAKMNQHMQAKLENKENTD